MTQDDGKLEKKRGPGRPRKENPELMQLQKTMSESVNVQKDIDLKLTAILNFLNAQPRSY